MRIQRSQTPAAFATYLALCSIGAGALALGCGAEAEAEAAGPQDTATMSAAPVALPSSYDPRKSLAPMIKSVGKGVVAVYTQDRRGAIRGAGSGFIISEDGLVVTNHHVVEHASGLQVRMSDGQRFEGKVLGSDAATDLALVRLEGASELPTVSFGKSAGLEVGDWVVAIGNPMGLEHSASVGIISGKGRGSLGLYRDSYLDFLQTDADIAPGSSGGPLFDFEGNVVGITTAVGAGAGSGPGFAIPIDTAQRVISQIRKHGAVSRGWLGAGSDPSSGDTGAVLGRVYEGTPAHKAGLREGDRVLSVDSEPIATFTELRSRIATTEPGQHVILEVERGSKRLSVDVELQERPEEHALGRLRPAEPGATPPPSSAPTKRTLPFGITLPEDDAPAEAAPPTRLGVSARATDRGLEIVAVEDGSLAAQLGLESGDRITEINGEKVHDAGAVAGALAKGGNEVSVRFDRQGAAHRVTLSRG